MNDTASFGYWVRRWRKALDLTQEQLAEQVACAVVTIKKIENDERRPSRQMAERLAICLAVPEAQRSKFVQVALGEHPAYTLYLPEKPVATSAQPRASSRIPAPLTRFIGRRAEAEAIKECVRRADVRLVTLSGPGGVGKTRLALQVAQELVPDFRDGVFFVSLASLNDPELVATAIAQAIEAHKKPNRSLKETLTAHLANQVTLLVLDNFEHLLPAGPFVSELLSATTALKILSTSRTPLHLYGERRFIVPPFDLPDQSGTIPDLEQNDAVALFVERAQAVRSGFRLTADNASSVAQICRRLDGLPLAIELAAAPMSVLSPQELLNHLESRLPLLTDGPRDVPFRQQTLGNTIVWSYELLAQTEKMVFERLAIFRGGGTPEAIESVCSDMHYSVVIEALAVLVDQNLLQRHEINAEPRFTMLETIREFATERLDRTGEADAIRQRHLAYYLNLAQRAEPKLTGKDEALWLDRLEIELDNIRTALEWGLQEDANLEIHESAAVLAGTLWYFWYCRGYWQEGSEWCKRALVCAPTQNRVRAKVLFGLGGLFFAQNYHEEARCCLNEAIPLLSGLNDLHGVADATHILGHVEFDCRNYDAARTYFTESLKLYQELNDELNTYTLVKDMGSIAYFLGEYDTARFYYENSLDWFRSHQVKDGVASVLHWLGDLERVSGSYQQAKIYYGEALQLNGEVNMPLDMAANLHRLGQVALHEKKANEAQSLLLDSLKLQNESGNRYGTAECLAGLAGVAVLQREPERAAKLFGAAEALLESIGTPLAPADRLAWEHDEKGLRAQLPRDILESAWGAGKTIAVEQILDEVMS